MGLASALSTALTGLTTAETKIDVVANNLANSQTIGFKESQVVVTSQFLQTLTLGSAPSSVSGGTNPRQIGQGARVNEVSPVFTQGTVQTSASATDLALQGDGFFIVQGSSGEPLYTRSGVFRTNEANEIVTTNGNRLLGYAVDEDFLLDQSQLAPLQIPVGSVRVAEATQNVTLNGILPSSGDVADTGSVSDSGVFGDASIPRPTTTASTIAPAPLTSTSGIAITTPDVGGTHIEGSVYQYKFAYLDSAGTESTISSAISVTVAGADGLANNLVQITSLPTLGSGEYTQIRIYRTEAGGSNFFRLGTVDLTATTSFTDVNPGDVDLTQALDETTISGSYGYLVSWANANSESRPTALSSIANVIDGRIHLQNLPIPPVPGPTDTFPLFDKIRIYRTTSVDSTSYYRVAEIDPALTNEYTDTVSDAQIVLNGAAPLEGPAITPITRLVDVLARDQLNYDQAFQVGTLSLSARKGGRILDTGTLNVTATTTIQELMDYISDTVGIQRVNSDPTNPIPGSVNNILGESGTLVPGVSLTLDGRIRVISNNGEDNGITIGSAGFSAVATDGSVLPTLVSFNISQKAVGRSGVTDFVVYDSLGIPIDVRVTAVLESRTGVESTYRWFADSSDNDPVSGGSITVGTGLIRFDGSGNFLSTTNSQISIDRVNIPSSTPLNFNLDFSSVSGLEANDAALAAVRQDGSAPGTLTNFSIGEDGVVRGQFSNGKSRQLGQIRLARFANPSGLQQQGTNLFTEGANSGLAIQGSPGENGMATMIAGAVELSNTDIGANLIDLILATTQYRGNSRVITAAQQLLDELLNLRR